MFNLRQLTRRFTNISLQGRYNPIISSFSRNFANKEDDRVARYGGGIFCAGPDKRKLLKAIDINVDALLGSEQSNTLPEYTSTIHSDITLPDGSKVEIIIKAANTGENSLPMHPTALRIKRLLRSYKDPELNKRFAEKVNGKPLDVRDINFRNIPVLED